MTKPVLGITIGDVAGIGPEITAKMLLNHPALREQARLVVVGDVGTMQRAVRGIGADPACVHEIAHAAQASNQADRIEVLQTGPALPAVVPGVLNPVAGDAAYRFVVRACDLAKAGEIDGIVTAPLNKAAMHAGGHAYPGHTELLAEQFEVRDFSLVLSAGDLYLFHLTTHVSLRQAIEDVTIARTREVLELAATFSRALGNPDETIAVAGLNPHAGENGLFGTEERDVLTPAIEAARREGLHIDGPLPADAVIPQAFKGRYKLLIACYHDQGHAPFKAVFGDTGVNITAGLPVIRVSVDHGTAFDIAGQGVARETSLLAAAERAARLSLGWKALWQAAQRKAN